jgi:hypothetical protein
MYLELNHQSDCTQHALPIKAPDMLEFKVQPHVFVNAWSVVCCAHA